MKNTVSRQIYTERINRVIDHIAAHLEEPLPLARLARLAHFSPFHFHRIFTILVGESVHAFTRRLRLEKAVLAMKYAPRTTLTDIALRCGFASSSDFSRAFKQAYGFSPRQFTPERFVKESKNWQDLLANTGYGFGKLPDPKNPDRFRVRLVERPAQRVAYVRVIGTHAPERLLAGFERLMAWGKQNDLVPQAELIGMSQDDPNITPQRKYRYDFCLVLPPGFKPAGDINVKNVPGSRFGALRCKGDIHKLDRAWNYLFRTWLPGSGHEPTLEPAMEVYRGHPAELGWSVYDIDCMVPVKPLGVR
ncbi:MAG TPA: GyrI-like domain-containing protein [Gemmataceae bacterium]|nr:GyrI-like domain-containing protein [Gemmataceae bacterium]